MSMPINPIFAYAINKSFINTFLRDKKYRLYLIKKFNFYIKFKFKF